MFAISCEYNVCVCVWLHLIRISERANDEGKQDVALFKNRSKFVKRNFATFLWRKVQVRIVNSLQVSAGGLVSALMGVQTFDTCWIGWPGELKFLIRVILLAAPCQKSMCPIAWRVPCYCSFCTGLLLDASDQRLIILVDNLLCPETHVPDSL